MGIPAPEPRLGKPLCSRLHLERIEQDLAKQKALAQVEHRSFDRRFEIQRLLGAWLKNSMRNEADLLRVLVPRGRNDGRAVVLNRRIDANPDRAARGRLQRDQDADRRTYPMPPYR